MTTNTTVDVTTTLLDPNICSNQYDDDENEDHVDDVPVHDLNHQSSTLKRADDDVVAVLLFYHYLSRELNFKTLYLGQSVPFEDLKEITKIFDTDIFISSFTTALEDEQLEEKLTNYGNCFPNQLFLIGGLLLKNYTQKNCTHKTAQPIFAQSS